MKVLAKPVSQKKILESVQKNSDPSKIHAAIVAKAECCVDHLCGCRMTKVNANCYTGVFSTLVL